MIYDIVLLFLNFEINYYEIAFNTSLLKQAPINKKRHPIRPLTNKFYLHENYTFAYCCWNYELGSLG